MWLDDCRIPFVDEVRTIPIHSDDKKTDGTLFGLHPTIQHKREITTQGRFTPNLLVCDDMLNDGVITQYNKTREDKGNYLGGHRKEYVGTTDNDIVKQIKGQFFSDKGSNSRYYDLDKWFDKIIDSL